MPQIPHHFPPFLWRFWLSSESNKHRPLRAYDVYSNELSETTSIPVDPSKLRPVFHDFTIFQEECLLPGVGSALKSAEQWFASLQSQAETILTNIIIATHMRRRGPSQGEKAGDHTQSSIKSLQVHTIQIMTLVKFFTFLRFRNSGHYRRIIRTLLATDEDASDTACASSTAYCKNKLAKCYQPIVKSIRIQQILTSFIRYLQADLTDPVSISKAMQTNRAGDSLQYMIYLHLWKFSIDTDVSFGLAAESGFEYILPDNCYGILDEAFGWGGEERDPMKECSDSFFPILPTLALYILSASAQDEAINPESIASQSQTTDVFRVIPIGTEQSIDISLRNAMILSAIPHTKNYSNQLSEASVSTGTSTPTLPGDNSTRGSKVCSVPFSTTSVYQVSLPSNDYATTMSMQLSLSFTGPKIYFSSLQSLTQTLSSYDECRCRWIPDHFIDYSRLKKRCRQLYAQQSITKTMMIKGEMLVDLSDEIQVDFQQGAVGCGAFSDVYQGKWYDSFEKKERVVAVKFLRQFMLQNVRDRLLKRLQEEILCWHSLSHQNIAQLFGLYQGKDRIGMVSAWCDNGPIGEYLSKCTERGKADEVDRLKLIVQIASGVAYLHAAKPPVVHGDLKGGNILIDHQGRPIITDFGLSRIIESSFSHSGQALSVSVSSRFAGSARWMAPELIRAQIESDDAEEEEEDRRKPPPEVTTSSDVWAFGGVCLEIVTGKLPYSHRKNDAGVTIDIYNGIKPNNGKVLDCKGLRFTCTPTNSPTPRQFVPKYVEETTTSLCTTRGEERSSPVRRTETQIKEDEFRFLLDRCWNLKADERPDMGKVSKTLVWLRSDKWPS